MKTYHGYRVIQQSSSSDETTTQQCVVQVVVNGRKRPLRLRLDIRNHSSTGFEWGYGGSGPAQLALALVADCCGKRAAIPPIYQRVKALVAALPHEGWTLTEEQVLDAVARAKEEANIP
jgi:hypothetical protein